MIKAGKLKHAGGERLGMLICVASNLLTSCANTCMGSRSLWEGVVRSGARGAGPAGTQRDGTWQRDGTGRAAGVSHPRTQYSVEKGRDGQARSVRFAPNVA